MNKNKRSSGEKRIKGTKELQIFNDILLHYRVR